MTTSQLLAKAREIDPWPHEKRHPLFNVWAAQAETLRIVAKANRNILLERARPYRARRLANA